MGNLKAEVEVSLKDKYSKGLNALKSGLKATGEVIKKTAVIMGTFTAGLGFTVKAAAKQEKRINLLSSAYTANAGAVELSWKALIDHANEIQENTTAGNELTQSTQALLLTFKNLKGDAFLGATEAAIDMAAAMNDGEISQSSLQSAAIQLGKALNDPIAGISALSDVGVSFTKEQKEQIKTLVKSGHTMDAQKIILAELNSEFGGTAKLLRDSLSGQLTATNNLFGDLQEQIGAVLTPIIRDEFLPAVQDMITDLAKLLSPQKITGFTREFMGGLLSIVRNFKVSKLTIQKSFDSLKVSFNSGFDAMKIKAKIVWAKITDVWGSNKTKIEELQAELTETMNKATLDRLTSESVTAKEIYDIEAGLLGKLEALDDARIKNVEEANEIIKGSHKKLSNDTKVIIKEQHKTTEQMMQEWLNNNTEMVESGSKTLENILAAGISSEGFDLGKSGEAMKEFLRGQILAWGAAEIFKATAAGLGAAIPSFGMSLVAAAGQVGAIGLASTAGIAAVNAINFNQGGIVPGPNVNKDVVPSMLTPRENVLSVGTNKKLEESLNVILKKLDNGPSGSINVNVMLDKKVLGRAIVDLQKIQGKGGL